MPRIRVSIDLPYLLRLPDGEYGGVMLRQIVRDAPNGTSEALFSSASSIFDAPEALSDNRLYDLRGRSAERLLKATNRVLRWYRATARQPGVGELTKAAASPFVFTFDESGLWWGGEPLAYETRALFAALRPLDEIAADLQAGLSTRGEPDVADLFLLDAEEARRTGRFREAVLFCWSTIDAVFNRRYDELVDEALAAEPRPARDFFKSAGGGAHFPIKHKMGAALYLLTGQTLTREPWWDDLSASYAKRNAIIHAGEGADEADAKRAIAVAQHVVAAMRAPAMRLSPRVAPELRA